MSNYFKKYKYVYGFVIPMLITEVIWLVDIFSKGMNSQQIDLFFLRFNDYFADFFNVVGYSGKLDPYHNTVYTGLGEKAYPPLTYVLLYLFSRLIDIDAYYENGFFLTMINEKLLFIMFLFITIGILLLLFEIIRNNLKFSRFTNITIAFLLLYSRPILFSFERGNTIIAAMMFVLIYLMNYDNENKFCREIAFLSLALAAALKITPVALGVLLLFEKRWKDAIRTIFYGLAAFFIPFFFLNGGKRANITQMITNIQLNLELYPSNQGITFEACLRNLDRIINNEIILSWIKMIVFGVLLYGVIFSSKKWLRVMLISLILVMAPSHSGDYCMLYMIPSYILFLNDMDHKSSDWLILIGIILTLQPIQTIITTQLISLGLLLICLILFIYNMVIFFSRQIKKHQIASPYKSLF